MNIYMPAMAPFTALTGAREEAQAMLALGSAKKPPDLNKSSRSAGYRKTLYLA
jgi:hypothetical protein